MKLVDPQSKITLVAAGDDALKNLQTGQTYRREDGVWRMLLPERAVALAQFITEYETVRLAEGRGSAESDYYRALPYRDLSGALSEQWRIRAASFDCFLKHVVPTLPQNGSLLDLGAGNGWLSARMAAMGFNVAAVDLMVNAHDGLGAVRHYPKQFLAVQAEFDWLPFEPNSADCVLFNASFHYATSYQTTLTEALRVLKPGGTIVIIDTPIYRHASSGEQMVREREADFEQRYGFRSNALPSENFLTWDRLAALGQTNSIKWQLFRPGFGLKWGLRPLRARLRGHREPAQFRLIVGRA